jgi:hypothetical protein
MAYGPGSIRRMWHRYLKKKYSYYLRNFKPFFVLKEIKNDDADA